MQKSRLKPLLAAFTTLAALLVGTSASADRAVADVPGNYALNLPLELPEHAALVRLELPEAVYEAMREPGLADLRVFNGEGELLPIAILPSRLEDEIVRGTAPLLPLPPRQAGQDEGLQLSLLRGPDGRLTRLDLSTTPGNSRDHTAPRTWLADLTDFPHPLSAVELDWGNAPGFQGHLRIEGSDDLQHWQALAERAAVMSAQGEGQRIERRRIELPPEHGKKPLRYLRLSWQGDQAAPRFGPLRLESSRKGLPGPSRWYSVKASEHNEQGGYRYVSKALLPVTGVDVRFAENNTVTQVHIASRLYPDTRWNPAAGGSVYRLGAGTVGEQHNPPFRFAERTHPLWQLEFDKATAPRTPPELLLGWTPHEIVFAARGPGPFILAAGKAGEFPLHYLVSEMVPGYGTAAAPPILRARIADTALSGTSGPRAVEAPRRDAPAWTNPRNWILWGVLIAGVLLLAFMARSLFQEQALKAPGKDGPP